MYYNLTMSYRLDSDIKWLYGKVTDLSSGLQVAPALYVKWKQPDDNFFGERCRKTYFIIFDATNYEIIADSEILKMIEKKHKMAAWFVSHCNAFSRRDEV